MAITPLEQYGTIGRTQDFAILKHQEDTKTSTEQMQIQVENEKETNDKLNQVRSADNAQLNGKKFDAKEKGDNRYVGDGGRNRKKKEQRDAKEKVVLKQARSFDTKI